MDELIALFQSAKANGDPAKYVHVISVAQAHQTANTLTMLRDALTDIRQTTERDDLSEGMKVIAIRMKADATKIEKDHTR